MIGGGRCCRQGVLNPPGFAAARQLYIHPDDCIDCTACVAECPVEAIYAEGDVPAGQSLFVTLNAELARQWPVIASKIPAPDDAAEWDGKPDKLRLLIR